MITKLQYEEYNRLCKEYEKLNNKAEHWKVVVDCWFRFYEAKKDEQPTFEALDRAALQKILTKLKKTAAKKGFDDWVEAYCLKIFEHFLHKAFGIEWISENFTLSILNTKFDIIIANGKGTTKVEQRGKGVDTNAALQAIYGGVYGK